MCNILSYFGMLHDSTNRNTPAIRSTSSIPTTSDEDDPRRRGSTCQPPQIGRPRTNGEGRWHCNYVWLGTECLRHGSDIAVIDLLLPDMAQIIHLIALSRLTETKRRNCEFIYRISSWWRILAEIQLTVPVNDRVVSVRPICGWWLIHKLKLSFINNIPSAQRKSINRVNSPINNNWLESGR